MKKSFFTLLKKIVLFTTGLFIMSLGVVLSVKADLGISPVSSNPYVLSLKYPLTLGMFTILFNVFLILLQVLILGKEYKIFQIVQFPVIFLLGFFIDSAMTIFQDLRPSSYGMRLSLCLLSVFVIALGVYMEIKAELTYLPGEGLALALVEKFGISFDSAKITVDTAMVLMSLGLSFVFFEKIRGLREGTVLAALGVGVLVRYYLRISLVLEKLIRKKVSQNLFS